MIAKGYGGGGHPGAAGFSVPLTFLSTIYTNQEMLTEPNK
jgi:nanoRNase/pAp phosphatase (c-di-AMP/oligoRNAs hydrolase)